ncbi:MAG: YihY/virulence factor BrkB family protein [Saprospiraceae bacterium]
MKSTKDFINKYAPWILSILEWSKDFSPFGFHGVSLYQAFVQIIEETNLSNIINRANSIAYSLFLSLFPTIIFIFALLPLMPVAIDFTASLKESTKDIIPYTAHKYIFDIVNDLVLIKRQGLLSLGAILALYFSSNGMLTLMGGFDKTYSEVFKKRNFIVQRFWAIGLTLLLTLLLIIALTIPVLQEYFLSFLEGYFSIPKFSNDILALLMWFITIFIIYTGISFIYRFGPSMYRKINFFNIGALLATVFTLVLSKLFSIYINNFGSFNEVYGSIGALMVLLIWIQLNSMILLIGFEINASIVISAQKSLDNS